MMLNLDKAVVIGKGSSRICYVHPEDAGKCIKINFSGNPKITTEELSHYRRYQRRKISWEMAAVSYGKVDTSAGEGVVFSLARDHDGNISRTLDYYLQSVKLPFALDDLADALETFKWYLLEERIVVRELKADNLVYQRTGSQQGKMIIVDGIGNNECLPLANYSRLFSTRAVSRKWRKFRISLPVLYPGNSRVLRLVEMLSD